MKVKYGQNTIIDDNEKTSVTLRTSKKMLEYDLQVQASGGSGNPIQFMGMYDMNTRDANISISIDSSSCKLFEMETN